MASWPRSVLLWALLLVGCAGGSTTTSPTTTTDGSSPVIATYGDSTLTLSEFETAYKKANDRPPPSSDSLAAYKDFLEQYVNFRLKVRAAREAGLDSLPSVQKDLHTYRRELARPRLMRKNVYEPLAQTLYERKKEEVDVSHILLRVDPDASPRDTLKAYRKMQTLADSLRQGVPFGDLAYRHSEDPSAQKKGQRGFRGHLGYLQAGQLVEPFEKRMYSVPPDSLSDIFRSQFGYHILKVHDRRTAPAPIRLSHIMIRADGDSASARRLLDSLRTAIVRDSAAFADLARTYSEDRRSASKGGDLGKVKSLQALPPSFRTAVTDLDSVGAVSPVVKSRFGYHLIKLTDREEHRSFEEAYDELKKQLSGRPRVERRKERFMETIRSDAGVTVDTTRLLAEAPISSLDTLSRPLLSLLDADSSASVPVASLGDSTYTLQQVARHVMKADGGARMTVGEVVDDFLDEKALIYAQARLEERDPSFAAMMKEYREGLLAFQFMQDSVWTAAAQDSAGLRRTYQQNRSQYRFPKRIRTFIFRAPADSLLSPYQKSESHTELPSLVRTAASDSLVTVDTVHVTESSPERYQDIRSVADGATVGPFDHQGESVLLIRDTLLPSRPKTFEEARSSVLREYQDRYEKQVLSRLRRKYDVHTYPERLRQAFSEQ